MERLAHMECDREKLSKESHELREQNELLEFRIIELEESHDKVSSAMKLWNRCKCSIKILIQQFS